MPIAICENQNIIASGTEIGHIDIWSVQNGQLLLRLDEHTSSIQCLDFSPTHPILASGSMDKTINLWNIESGVFIKKLEGHTKGVISIAFSEDGQFIASGGLDFKVIIWEFENHLIYWEFGGYSSEIVSVSFSPDGKTFAFAELNGFIHLWDTQNEEFKQTKEFEQKLFWAKFLTNDEFLILTNENIIHWEINSIGMKIIKLQQKSIAALYLKKSEKLIIYGTIYAYAYDLIKQKLVYQNMNIKKTILTFISNQIKETSEFKIYQSMFASKDKHNTVNIEQQDQKFQIKHYKEFPIASCLSYDQNILALSNFDKSLQLWDLQKNSQICLNNILDTQINHLKFSKKGDILACRTFEKIIILFNENLQEVNRLELPDICYSDIFISPDSQYIVCEIQKGLFIWKVDQSEFIQNISSNDEVNRNEKNLICFDFSKDSQYIIFLFKNDDYTFIWDIQSKNCCCKKHMAKEMSCFSLPIQNKFYQFESVSTRKCKIFTNLGDYGLDQSCALLRCFKRDEI